MTTKTHRERLPTALPANLRGKERADARLVEALLELAVRIDARIYRFSTSHGLQSCYAKLLINALLRDNVKLRRIFATRCQVLGISMEIVKPHAETEPFA
jgi:hypothetical protein